jgi:hypothetical protein
MTKPMANPHITRRADFECCPVGTMRALNATRAALQAVLRLFPRPRPGRHEIAAVAKARKVIA